MVSIVGPAGLARPIYKAQEKRLLELLLLQDGGPGWSHPVGTRKVNLGRAPSNDLVFRDPMVSGDHAVVWQEQGIGWVRDLGSANGTFLNDRRILGPEPFSPGDFIRLGPTTRMQIRGDRGAPALKGLQVEELGSGARVHVVGDRFAIGSGTDADLRLDGGPARVATLLLHHNGEVWLGTDQEERPILPGEQFVVGGGTFQLIESPMAVPRTAAAAPDRYPYLLSANLQGSTGPEAALTDLRQSRTHRIEGQQRSVLLFLLGRQLRNDLQRGANDAERGWCDDEVVMTGVWGRQGNENKLHVLVHRLRAELRNAGFDPWFIEKRQRYIRARLNEVTVTE